MEWERFARSRGGEFRGRGAHRFYLPGCEIECDYREVRVLIDQCEGNGNGRQTRVRARYPLGVGPRYRMYRRGSIVSADNAEGQIDVLAGKRREFDTTFAVLSDEPEATRRVWGGQVQAWICKYFPHAEVTSDGTTVTLRTPGIVTDCQLLDYLLACVGRLADIDVCGVDALRDVPEAVYVPPSGPWDRRSKPRARLSLRTAAVTIEPMLVRGRVFTRAMAQGSVCERPWSAVIRDSTRAEELATAQGIDLETAHHLCRAGAGTIARRRGEAVFLWPEVQTEPRRLSAAARGVAKLTEAESRGLYR